MVRSASSPSGSSTASLCRPHSDFRRGVAAASAAAAEGTNTMVLGGGASSPAFFRSDRICLASATSFRTLGTTSRRCDTSGGTRPGTPIETSSGARRCPFRVPESITHDGTFTPHSTICLSSVTGSNGDGLSSSSIASGNCSKSWSASSATIVCAKSTSSLPSRFIRASNSGVPTTSSAMSANPSRTTWSSSNTPTHLIPCGPL
mmetsp:Transcript_4486/g.18428  ORF Transcript_4486/g.18428 Transcript_4486/m.18428 type:complete len:204 (+) Transcript_4486:828-1439(+)